MHRRYTSILFDLDGTLVDTAPGITSCIAYTLETLGWPQESPEQLLLHCGPPLYTGFTDISSMPADTAQRAVGVYRERYVATGISRSQVFPGIQDLLETLHRRGHPLAVATSKSEDTAVQMLTHFGIASLFTTITGADPASGRSAKADVVRTACERLARSGADVTAPLLIGDRIFDVDGGRQAGVDVLGVRWGYAPDDEELSGAIQILDTPEDVAAFLE